MTRAEMWEECIKYNIIQTNGGCYSGHSPLYKQYGQLIGMLVRGIQPIPFTFLFKTSNLLSYQTWSYHFFFYFLVIFLWWNRTSSLSLSWSQPWVSNLQTTWQRRRNDKISSRQTYPEGWEYQLSFICIIVLTFLFSCSSRVFADYYLCNKIYPLMDTWKPIVNRPNHNQNHNHNHNHSP